MLNKTERQKEQILRMSGVNPKKCMRCGKCSGTCPSYDEMEYHPHPVSYTHLRQCPVNAISGKVKQPFVIDLSKCIRCGSCVGACPFHAIKELSLIHI